MGLIALMPCNEQKALAVKLKNYIQEEQHIEQELLREWLMYPQQLNRLRALEKQQRWVNRLMNQLDLFGEKITGMYCELKPVCQLCVKLETDLELARAELKRLDAELSALKGAKKEGSL
jgi:hypothetical protein